MASTRIAIKMRIKPPKRRTPQERLKARLYYRRNRGKIRVQRRKYMRKWKSTLKRRKLFHRYKPGWIKKPKHKKPTPHKVPHFKKFKIKVPKFKHFKHTRPRPRRPRH